MSRLNNLPNVFQLVGGGSMIQSQVNNSLSFPPLTCSIIDFTTLRDVPACPELPWYMSIFSGIIVNSTCFHLLKAFTIHLSFLPKLLFDLSYTFYFYCSPSFMLPSLIVSEHRWLRQNFFFLFLQTLLSTAYLHTETVMIILEPR